MSWTDFDTGEALIGFGPAVFKLVGFENSRYCWKSEGTINDWFHILLAPMEERDPRFNHIHIKGKLYEIDHWIVKLTDIVVCSVKIENERIINRREFIYKINMATNLNIQYQ